MQAGDIALLWYTTKYTAPSYRLCRVVGVKVGEDGLVRSCDVALKPRRKGEDQGKKYQHKTLATITVGVQRIAVILPVEEQEREEGGRSQLQEEPKAVEGSQGQEDESRQGRTTQSNNEPVQERSSPERGEATQQREQPRRNCRK